MEDPHPTPAPAPRPDTPQPPAPPARRPGPIAGWLFFCAGVAMLVSALLVPAAHDLALARERRDRALALESHALARIDRHLAYLEALDRGDPDLIRALAASQLNLIPAGRSALIAPGRPVDVDLFGAIEPVLTPFAEARREPTLLERVTLGGTARLWVVAVAAVVMLVGILPPARAARR